jgi:hypothetical protein
LAAPTFGIELAYDDNVCPGKAKPMNKTSKLTLSKTTIKNLNLVRSGIKGGISAKLCYVSEVIGPGCGSNKSGSNSSDTP